MRQFITFISGAEEYGIDIIAIREIKGWVPVAPLPEMPRFMRGVIDLRGAIVPILDLRARFGGSQTEATPRHVVIVVAIEDRVAGLLVDAVADILAIEDGDVQPVPDTGQDPAHAFLSGLVSVQGRMVALLNLAQVFDMRVVADAIAA